MSARSLGLELKKQAAMNAGSFGLSRRAESEQKIAKPHKCLLFVQISLHSMLTNIWTVLGMKTIILGKPWVKLHQC